MTPPEDDSPSMGAFVVNIATGGIIIATVASLSKVLPTLVAPIEAFAWGLLQVLNAAALGPMFPTLAVITTLATLYVVVSVVSRVGNRLEMWTISFDREDDQEEDVDPIEEIRERYALGEIDELEMEAELEDVLEDDRDEVPAEIMEADR